MFFSGSGGGLVFSAGALNETLNASAVLYQQHLWRRAATRTGGDTIIGGIGKDTFIAGAGADSFVGGPSDDAFAFFESVNLGQCGWRA